MADRARAPGAVDGEDALVVVDDLKVHFPVGRARVGKDASWIKAVDGVSLMIRRRETLSLVGESGCGKSTAGRAILQLERVTGGSVVFDGTELTSLSANRLRPLRRRMQMIFQDPYASLNPRMTVAEALAEPLQIHGLAKGAARGRRVDELLEQVGLSPRLASHYPGALSGGQRQRVGIARALAAGPDLIVADEAVSALDVSIQAQIVNLLEDLQEELGLAFLFITHDLAVVSHVSDRVAVMYLGKIVELADADELYQSPLHPYTAALLSAVPVPDPEMEANRQRILLSDDVPSPLHPPSGCRFRTRCWLRARLGDPQNCVTDEPPLRDLGGSRTVACHWAEHLADGTPHPSMISTGGGT